MTAPVVPATASASPVALVAQAATDDEGLPPAAWAGIAVAVVVGGGGVLYFATRGRRQDRPDDD